MQHLVLLVVVLMVSACVPAVPIVIITPGAGEVQPASDVMDEAAVKPRDGAGAIVITRPQVWLGRRCTYDIAIDDRHVAGLRPGEQLEIYADPGARMLDISIRDEGRCKPATARVSLDVTAHATNRIMLDSDPRYDLKVEVNSLGGSLPE
jgi:hypothetical protein